MKMIFQTSDAGRDMDSFHQIRLMKFGKILSTTLSGFDDTPSRFTTWRAMIRWFTTKLVGGFNPLEKYDRQNGFIFPKFRGENSKNVWSLTTQTKFLSSNSSSVLLVVVVDCVLEAWPLISEERSEAKICIKSGRWTPSVVKGSVSLSKPITSYLESVVVGITAGNMTNLNKIAITVV